MEIYHAPLIPAAEAENGYRITNEHYEADADTLRGYINDLLPDLNACGDGTWRLVHPDEIQLFADLEITYCVLRGDYPGEAPILVAFYAREKSEVL